MMNRVAKVSLFLATCLLSACATTRRAELSAPTSGFLTPGQALSPGREDEPGMLFRADGWQPRGQSFFVDPVPLATIGEDEGSAPSPGARAVAETLRSALRDRLVDVGFSPVEGASEADFVVRASLFEVGSSIPVLESFTTLLPQAVLVSYVVESITGTRPFAGCASVELEVLTRHGDVYLQFLDKREGAKSPRGVFSAWSDAEGAALWWAEYVANALVSGADESTRGSLRHEELERTTMTP
ncbi:MAG: DUF3313 family protein [Planctomycetota bacterium]